VCGLDIGFIDHLYTPLGTTRNYSAIADLHNLQITTAAAKPFPNCWVLTSRSLATTANSGDSSASRAQVLFVTAARAELSSIPSIPTDNYQLRNSQFNSLLQPPTANYLVAILSQLSTQLAWGRTQQKTPLSKVPLFCNRIYRSVV
jgi:hypothetical protein